MYRWADGITQARVYLFVVGPQVHRMHLWRLPEQRDQNFAQGFSVLDRLVAGYDEFPLPVRMA